MKKIANEQGGAKFIIPYQPRALQRELHNMLTLYRFMVIVCHRRFGKTVLAINELIKQILTCNLKNPRGAYICPTQVQARKVAWTYIKDYTRDIPGIKHNESQLTVKFPNGAEISLMGAENYNNLRGIYLDFCVIDETGQVPPAAWSQVIRPALSDRKGGAIFIGTPFGTHNMFYDMYENAVELAGWSRAIYRASETNLIDPDELNAMQVEMSPEEYQQELECSWSAAIKGAYYAPEMHQMVVEERITTVPYDETHPVITSWDLGMRDATVIGYWQIVAGQYRLIRSQAFTYTSLPEICKEVLSHGYFFSQHIAPHDISQHEFGTGKQRIEVAGNHGIYFDVCPNHFVVDGISSVRSGLKRTVIDAKNNKDVISALQSYRSVYDETKRVASLKPLHDWASDYADMVRYFFMSDHQLDFGTSSLDYSRIDQGKY